MDFLKKLIESPQPEALAEMAQDVWNEVEGVREQIGNFIVSADGYYTDGDGIGDLYVSVYNTDTKQAYRVEAYRGEGGFEMYVTSKEDGVPVPVKDEETSEFVKKLVTSFLQKHYNEIVAEPDTSDYSSEDDDYHTRRDKLRQARDYRSEIDSD